MFKPFVRPRSPEGAPAATAGAPPAATTLIGAPAPSPAADSTPAPAPSPSPSPSPSATPAPKPAAVKPGTTPAPTSASSPDPDATPEPAAIWPDDWRAKIAGEDAKVLKRLERYATPREVAMALAGLQERINAGELRSHLPKNATPEQVNQWRQENGIPESPEKYDLKLKDGTVLSDADKAVVDGYLKAIHGKNANNDVATEGLNWYFEEVGRQRAARLERDAEFARSTEDVLRTEYGADYRANMNLVRGLIDLAPEAVRADLQGARLGSGDPLLSHPETIRWLVNLAREINPPTALVTNTGAGVVTSIEDELKTIEGWMKAAPGSADYKKYWNDPKISGPDGRYSQLLEGLEKARARNL